MKGEEPSTCLVYSFCDKICRERFTVVDEFAILERIVYLCVRHGSRVEPNVDKVEFACQHVSCLAHQLDIIYVWTMEVNLIVVRLTHIARYEAFFFQRIAAHHTCSYSLLDFVIELFYRTNADFLAGVAIAPDWKRCAPIATA